MHSFFVQCSLVVTGWEMDNLFDLLRVVFSCVCHFPGVLGWVWFLIVSIPDFCLLTNLEIANAFKPDLNGRSKQAKQRS